MAFAAAKRGNAQALIALDDILIFAHRSRIVSLAASSRLPVMYGYREFSDVGGLISYGPNLAVLFRSAAIFVDKILKGPSPPTFPSSSRPIDFIVNLKAAKALGLSVPPTLLTQADEVIE